VLGGNPKELRWSEECQAAFLAAKAALAAVTHLAHPEAAASLSLATDASASHVGAVLQQKLGSEWAPLAFFSKKLSPAQVNYSTFDRELLAVFLALKHFRFSLEGRSFVIFTDHKPLISALKQVSPPASARQQRQLAYVAEFDVRMVHTPGEENVVADVLSRPSDSVNTCHSLDQVCEAVDFQQMALLQATCEDVAGLRASPSLKGTSVLVGELELWGDVSTGVFRPFVPRPLRRAVFDFLHVGTHPGIRATNRLVSARFVWPRMSSDVGQWARDCITCQQSKITSHVKLKPDFIPVPPRRFAHMHVDLVGPLPESDGCRYIFTMTDRSTRWVEAVPLPGVSAQQCATALCSTWISRFGVPAQLTSDKGAQFTSALWKALYSLLNIRHVPTSSFHPQSNGILERWHRTLKSSLRAKSVGSTWAEKLPFILMGLRATPREETASSPAEAVFGSQLVLPGQFLDQTTQDESFTSQLKSVLKGFVPAATVHNSNKDLPTSLPEELLSAEFVFVRRDRPSSPLDRPYDGPFKVVRRSHHTFQLQMGDSIVSVSSARLKPLITQGPIQVAVPPRRGRPKKSVSFDLQSR
jgi:cleavage and polyadenylation specificity factor subunit 1